MEKSKKKQSAYAKAGVDIEAAKKAVDLMKDHIRSTYNEDTLTDVGSFAGLFDVSFFSGLVNPVLVQSIDGVGTKLQVSEMMEKYTVGQCIVNHCINDIMTFGAVPLTFLNYLGTDHLKPEIMEKIVAQMAIACQAVGIPILSGETAEMPGVYREGRQDLVGCITGVVEKSKIIDGSKITEGDILIGLPSSGLHTNGYSLARKAFFETTGYSVNTYLDELGWTVGEELLKIHKCYYQMLSSFLYGPRRPEIHGIAHITGGGLIDNISRLLPEGLFAEIFEKWEIPVVFKLIQEIEKVSDSEMRRIFNLGIGMVLIVSPSAFEGKVLPVEMPIISPLGKIKKTRFKKKKVIFTY